MSIYNYAFLSDHDVTAHYRKRQYWGCSGETTPDAACVKGDKLLLKSVAPAKDGGQGKRCSSKYYGARAAVATEAPFWYGEWNFLRKFSPKLDTVFADFVDNSGGVLPKCKQIGNEIFAICPSNPTETSEDVMLSATKDNIGLKGQGKRFYKVPFHPPHGQYTTVKTNSAEDALDASMAMYTCNFGAQKSKKYGVCNHWSFGLCDDEYQDIPLGPLDFGEFDT